MSDVFNLVKMVFGRGVIRAVKDSGPRQQTQVEMLKNEIIDDVEHMQNYGFTSHPTGGDCAVAFNGGSREQGIVLVIDDRRYRIPLLGGEVAMYDDLGNKVELLRDMVKVTAVQHLEAMAPTIKLIGDLELVGDMKILGNIDSTGTITNNSKRIDSTHTHASGGSGVPN